MKDPKKPDYVLFQAAEWFLRIEDGPLSEAEKSEFLAWLRSSPLHVRTYLSAARVARCLPSAYKKGPIQESLIDTLSRAVPELLEESKRRTWEYEIPETLKRRLNQSAIRRKGNGVSRDS